MRGSTWSGSWRGSVLHRLGAVDCPALVCVGELDPVTPPAASQELYEALPAGTARLEVVPGAGHFTWKDAPERYWPLLLDFVASDVVGHGPAPME